MHIQFLNQQNKFLVSEAEAAITACLEQAFSRSALARASEISFTPQVNVSFVSEAVMRATNRDTRGIPKVTDVLSFPMLEMLNGEPVNPLQEADFHPDFDAYGENEKESGEDEEVSQDSEDTLPLILELGDIMICPARAAEQAENYGHSLLRELSFLALHGCLHLLGYDHEQGDTEEAVMFALQEEILTECGITRDLNDVVGATLLEDDDNMISTAAAEQNLPENFRSGFVAIVGRPNSGKSTLLNRLSGDELAITSPKAQTTRHNIRTVLDDGHSQIIFVDTPGIHRSHTKLDRYMTDSAWFALQDADLGLLLVDPAKGFISAVERVCCQKAEELGVPLILLLTKTDSMTKEELLPVIQRFSNFYAFADIIPVSALRDDNIDLVMARIREILPVGPRYYSPEAYTDQTERALAAEYIREQLLRFTHQEIPHYAAVEIEAFKEVFAEDGERTLVRIMASIITEKGSHKGIIIGKDGQSLKRIGQAARIKLETLLDCKVYLEIHVKVRKDWQNQEAILNSLGYVKGKAGPSSDDIL